MRLVGGSFGGRLFAIYLLFACAAVGYADDIVISLPSGMTVKRTMVRFQCDKLADTVALPTGPFTVEYINSAPIALAVIPVDGKPLVFANVMSGSGARYAADRYIWWDAGSRGVTMSVPTKSGAQQKSSCHLIHSPH